MLQINPHVREDVDALRHILREASRRGDCDLLVEAIYWLAHLRQGPVQEDEASLKNSFCEITDDLSFVFLQCFARKVIDEATMPSSAPKPGREDLELADTIASWVRVLGLWPSSESELVERRRFCEYSQPRRGDTVQRKQPFWDGFRWFVWDAARGRYLFLGDSPEPRFQRHQQTLSNGREIEGFVYWNGFGWVAMTLGRFGNEVSAKGFWNPDLKLYEEVSLPVPENGYRFSDKGLWDPESKQFEADGDLIEPTPAPAPRASGADWFVRGAVALFAVSAVAFIVSRWRR